MLLVSKKGERGYEKVFYCIIDVNNDACCIYRQRQELTFYMITHSLPADVFWGGVYKGMNDMATALNVKAVYLGSKVSGDVAEMVSNLETAIETQPDGIAISVTDPNALEPLIREAIEKGIPVVAINVADFRPEEERIPYLRYIGEDSYLTGAAQAKAVLKVFQEQYGRPPKAVVYGSHEAGNVVQAKRAQGVIDTVKAAGTEKAEAHRYYLRSCSSCRNHARAY